MSTLHSTTAFRLLALLAVSSLVCAGLISVFPVEGVAYASPEANTIRIAPTGSDASGCGSESSPCKTIQYAVNKAATGDTILVAGGSYTYQSAADSCTFLVTRAVACVLNKHLSILGGYSTSNWSTPDPVGNLTIIDGENYRRGVAVIAYNSTAYLRMEGITIQNGLAQGNTTGGDFYIDAAGGGMWLQGGAVTLRQMVFKNNRAVGGNTTSQYGGAASGGGLAIHSPANNATSLLEDVTFEGNQAVGGSGARRGGLAYGGGLYTYSAVVSGNHLTFTNNLAQAGDSAGSGVDGVYGLRADALGGAAGFGRNSNATLAQVTANGNVVLGGDAGNVSGSVGGGAFGGAFFAEQLATLTLQDAHILGNAITGGKASTGGFAMGGGIMTDSAYLYTDRVQISANQSVSGGAHSSAGVAGQTGGGGAYLASFSGTPGIYARLVNTIVSDNWVAVGSPGRFSGGAGAGMTVQAMRADLVHSTLAGNRLGSGLVLGGAVSVQGLYGESGTPAVVNIDYSIIANHVNTETMYTAAVSVMRNSSVDFNNGIFANNTNDTNANSNPILPGAITGLSTMINVGDLNFVSPGSPNYDYHLLDSSPAIDQATSGSIPVDIDGDMRPFSTSPDIGADEYNQPAMAATPDQFLTLLGASQVLTQSIQVQVTTGTQVPWSAETNAAWLFLGPEGSAHQTQGAASENLLVWVNADYAAMGTNLGVITINGEEVNPTTVEITLVKAEQIYTTSLPLLLR